MNPVIKQVLDGLRAGHVEPAYEYKEYLNDIALTIYNKPELDQENIKDLKDILTICNITYNDTDRTILPIEDGVYDLLLEKYKKYDPNFQVGAEVIDFKSSSGNKMFVATEMKPAITFIDPPSDKEAFFKDDIVIDPTKYIDRRDFENKSYPIDMEFITKRHHDTEHEHPELVGTLDKCKFVLDKDASERGVLDDANVKTVERDFFQNHLMRGIISPNERFDMILELKYDGVSVEADCTDEVVSARSRGDTGIGKASDFTPLLKGYRFPHRPKGSPSIGVKFEAIITQYDLPAFNAAKGYEYKNCRSAIVGLMASGDAWKYRDFITLVPLAVEEKVYREECNSDRMKEIEYLNTYFVSKGCPLRHTMVTGTYIENLAWINLFTHNAETMRYMVPFMYDGVVVSYRDERIRQALGRENFINKYSIAVKFNPLRKETIFRGYSYTVGQDGSVTPMIHYDPVEFFGTIHNKSSGHSYARFQELQLHKGDILAVEYVNDVMPYVSKPINDFNLENEKVTPLEQFPTVCPICGGPVEVSNSSKSARCLNPNCGGRQLARMVNMCAKLNMDGFGEATIIQLGTYHLFDMVNLVESDTWPTEAQARGFGPVETQNIKGQIDRLITEPLVETQLLGAIGFTGISTKTWELITPKLTYQKLRDTLDLLDPSGIYKKRICEFMSGIKGIGPSTADTIIREIKYFRKDLDWMYEHANVVKFVPREGKKVIFSGFRDQELTEYLESLGFLVDDKSNVTMSTYALLVPNEGFSSVKTAKAEKFNVQIVPVQEFRENIQKYL